MGFAAETQNLEQNAQKKRLVKGVEMIAANRVGANMGFDTDDNELLLVWEGGSRLLERDAKPRLARLLIEQIAALYSKQPSTEDSTDHDAKHSA